MRRLLSLISLLMVLGHVFTQDRITGESFATRSEVIAQYGMACTSQPLATQVALDILKAGGNAIDAAIAANAVLGLVEPTGNGIGGDLFAIVWDAETGKLYGLNASGRSPRSLTLDYFTENGFENIPAYGPLPVSVPGCVDGWFELHGKFGSMKMDKILQPAISYATEGFPVTELIAYYWAGGVRRLIRYPNVAEVYMPGGNVPSKGEIFRNPFLANTLKKIAEGGRDEFYKGDIARTIDKFIKEQGGFLSYEDLANHHSEWVEPVSANYRGYDVWELPPNGQGIAALQILNILEGFDIAAMGFGSSEYIHHFVEAKKLAFEDRAKYYADPAFRKIPVEVLISEDYASERRKLINPQRASRTVDAGKIENGNTIYLTVADKEGNMVSLIQSNYLGLGSGMCPPGLGFILQDRGELFTLEEGHNNVYEPGKRPFNTIIPAFITRDPRIRHGGSSQPTGEKMNDGGIVNLESDIPNDGIRELVRRGHTVQFSVGGYGGYQAILWDEEKGVYFGASESRKDGQAAGY